MTCDLSLTSSQQGLLSAILLVDIIGRKRILVFTSSLIKESVPARYRSKCTFLTASSTLLVNFIISGYFCKL
ncbi:unnamed protein product [Leptidea sinapis]|uniref:Uncharacterized protein n=1 Tax=Leptidea sinapis TaxID=189913 RepID=A0A5E4QUU8_9NEOP|nr:unnamed protein product [Leptidea sinapis]